MSWIKFQLNSLFLSITQYLTIVLTHGALESHPPLSV